MDLYTSGSALIVFVFLLVSHLSKTISNSEEAKNAKTPVIVERIVDEIDGIVRIVRFPGWQDTETGRREVSMELYGIFARKKLFDKDLVEKAYKYVEQYY